MVHQSIRAVKEKGLQAWVRREVEWPNRIKNPSSNPSPQRRPEPSDQKTRECTTRFPLYALTGVLCECRNTVDTRKDDKQLVMMIMMQGTNTDKNPEMITSSMCDQLRLQALFWGGRRYFIYDANGCAATYHLKSDGCRT